MLLSVAKTLIVKEVLIYKGNRLAITKSTEEPDESAKQEQVSSVSSRMVDVSEIPPDMTTVMLTMLLENNCDGEIESIDHDLSRNTAVATFTDSVGMCKFLCTMQKLYILNAHCMGDNPSFMRS